MVARVRMSNMLQVAYAAAIKAVIARCNSDTGTNLAQSLQGIIVDWQTAQINGIKDAFGENRAEELLRGCRVSSITYLYSAIIIKHITYCRI